MKMLPKYLSSKLLCEILAAIELCDETEKVNLLKLTMFWGAHVHVM